MSASGGGPFSSYEKMANNSNKWPRAPTGDFVVTEKVHGANFSIWITGNRGAAAASDQPSVRFGKRNGMLSDDDDFYGMRSSGLAKSLEEPARRLYAAVCDALADGDESVVTIYGELFGGFYPGLASASAIKGPVQIGVWYSADLEFMPFDVAVQSRDGTDRRYLDFEDAQAYCNGAGFHFARPLFVGSFNDAMAYPHEFESTIPSLLGLPPLDDANLAEGCVVKAAVEHTTNSGKRLILKRKIDGFAEFGRKEVGAPRTKACPSKNLSTEAPAGVDQTELTYFELLAGVTEPRLAAVMSKDEYDLSSPDDCRKLLRSFIGDIVADLDEDEREKLSAMSDDARKATLARVRESAKAAIVAYSARRAKLLPTLGR